MQIFLIKYAKKQSLQLRKNRLTNICSCYMMWTGGDAFETIL